MKRFLSKFFDAFAATAVTFFVIFFLLLWPTHLEIKALGLEFGASTAEALSSTTDTTPPPQSMQLSWARIAGREGALYLSIPANELGSRLNLPQNPSSLILAKYDSMTNTGQIAIMRMRLVAGNLQAVIQEISPANFQHFAGPDLYTFAYLEYHSFELDAKGNTVNDAFGNAVPYTDPVTNATCISEYPHKSLMDSGCDGSVCVPPNVNTASIIAGFHANPNATFSLDPSTQAAINRSDSYWHQRLNNDPCWIHRNFQEFDNGDGIWHNVSAEGFLNIVALAQWYHKAPVSFVANTLMTPHSIVQTSGDVIYNSVNWSVWYTIQPDWFIGTSAGPWSVNGNDTTGRPKGPCIDGAVCDTNSLFVNPTQDPNGTINFVRVVGDHSFPIDQWTAYSYTGSAGGFTGIFIFIAAIALGAITGGLGSVALGSGSWAAALGGAGVGAVGGLVASGFSPSTSVTAAFTPFVYSAYQLAPNLSGDSSIVAGRTQSGWINPPMLQTPPTNGGVQAFTTNINFQQALACGGAAETSPGSGCMAPAVTTVPMSDSRFNSVFGQMFGFAMYAPQAPVISNSADQTTYPYTNP